MRSIDELEWEHGRDAVLFEDPPHQRRFDVDRSIECPIAVDQVEHLCERSTHLGLRRLWLHQFPQRAPNGAVRAHVLEPADARVASRGAVSGIEERWRLQEG